MKFLLTSRKFWALLIGLLVLILSQFVPSFHLDEEAAIGLTVIVFSYIVGVAIDPGPNAGTWRGVIQSRKFWGALIGLTLIFLDGFDLALPAALSPDLLVWLCVTIGGYISGVALEGLGLPQLIRIGSGKPDAYEE